MEPPKKPYDPSRVHNVIKRVPIRGELKYGAHEAWPLDEYPLRALMAHPKDIILLRTVYGKVGD